ncbi:DUF1707 domain-containing protein [Nocardioides zeae]|uniref:DUF1707 domain-containing protein n=1 Tax=Nocardioides imazamoxiresistens TaxID=3231893 RepID=A0ABU3PW17_9ACTN|nr:DUF1707 domain-containing protein [Nocardioides zeae]MDT9593076.1 DUF1707 domain-containing protein [Nocardioides zeae]
MSEPAEIRLSDAERAEAAQVLQDHLADGRLDVDEHAERSVLVWQARYARELRPLFADLPAPHPEVLAPRPPRDWNRRPSGLVEQPRRRPGLVGPVGWAGSGVLVVLAVLATPFLAVVAGLDVVIVVLALSMLWAFLFARRRR